MHYLYGSKQNIPVPARRHVFIPAAALGLRPLGNAQRKKGSELFLLTENSSDPSPPLTPLPPDSIFLSMIVIELFSD